MEITLRYRQTLSWLVLAAVFAIGLWFLPSLLQVILLIFAGTLLGNFLCHLSSDIARMLNVRYGIAYSIVILTIGIASIATLYFMGSRISQQANQLVAQLNQAGSEVSSQFDLQHQWERLQEIDWPEQRSWAANRAVSTATSAAWGTLSAIGSAAIVLFLGFYFALQPTRYRDGFLALINPSARERVSAVLRRASDRLWRWVVGRLIGMVVIALCTAIGLWLLGIPLPITLAVIAGMMNFVPNIGPIIAGIPAVLLGLQQGTNVAIYVLIFYFVLQFLESYLLTPFIDQHQVSIPPGLMLSAQLVLGVVAGFLGLLLATPLTVLIVILVSEFYVKNQQSDES